MKAFLIYWIIGCVLLGGYIGERERFNQPALGFSDDLKAVAIWPAYVIGGVLRTIQQSSGAKQ